jgi:hypothetical protein
VLALIRNNLPKKQKLTSFRHGDSRKINELQLADMVAGVINRSLTDKNDANDYLELLKDKIITIRKI